MAEPPVELSDVAAGVGGFVINGIDAFDVSGVSVSGAGDVNGDGLADLIVGASGADPGGVNDAGESYVVFGKAGPAAVDLAVVAAGAGGGFVINGIDPYDSSGISVSGAGDVNGDGLADLIVGAFLADPDGESYVVFGKADTAAVDLAVVAAGAGGGFVINGIDPYDNSGGSVSGAGDVNGDGLADLIVGAQSADPGGDSSAGESYVVFGKADTAAVELAVVAAGAGGGFVINGIDPYDFSGSVSGAGDVNGDGLADLIVGATNADPGGDHYAGESYVVFGKAGTAAVDLAVVAAGGGGGFVINGIDPFDYSGIVSGAGDVNGDGLADLIVGAIGADPGGDSRAGESYVVFGKAGTAAVDLAVVAAGAGGGFVINGIDPYDYSGRSVSGAGDVNGDGLADLIVGAYKAEPGGDSDAGESYVVFGRAGTAPVNLADVVAGTGGFVINGIDVSDLAGGSVSGAGDVNGDGLADLIVGAFFADPGGDSAAGDSYVVFAQSCDTSSEAPETLVSETTGTLMGAPSSNAPQIELFDVAAGYGGYVINGIDPSDYSGYSVSGAGDVNGDGLADLIVGAFFADPGGDISAGECYVVFGKTGTAAVDLAVVAAGAGGGFVINGIDPSDFSGLSVSGAGDVNGDGLTDLIVGAPRAVAGGDVDSGESYVVFGKAGTAAVNLAVVAAGAGGGFIMNGIDAGDWSGRSVAGAGDVNGDGLADLIVGAPFASPGGDVDAGRSYVVFGKVGTAPVNLAVVAAGLGGGFVISGIDPGDRSGISVSGAGDVNGDGLADLIVGADGADPGGDSFAGESYVVFGKAGTAPVDLAVVAAGAGGGFVISGIDPYDVSGSSVSGAGDVNGDGLADLIVGASQAGPGGDTSAGESYVVFGKAGTAAVDLAVVAAGAAGAGGFGIIGIDPYDRSGGSVSGAGDVNGDGLADIIVGAWGADPGGVNDAGESYVVFGKAGTAAVDLALVAAGAWGGFVINGIDPDDGAGFVSGAGDVNGDGLADVIVGASAADPGGDNHAGESYVVFAPAPSCTTSSPASVNLIAGPTGTLTGFLSFNEARGVDVTVLGTSNQFVSSMTLAGLSISTPSATLSARIYHSASSSLIASASTTVSSGSNQTVTIPVSTTLIDGSEYRLCFFVSAGGSGGSGNLFDPEPHCAGGFPYTEATVRFRVNHAYYSLGADSFPIFLSTAMPQMTVASASACPGDFDGSGYVGFGDMTMLLINWGPCPANCPWDLDGSGNVGFGDLTTLLLKWG